MDVTLNGGDPVKAARQPTNGHLHLTGTAATGRIMSTTAVQLSQICFTVSVLCLFMVFFTVFFSQKPLFYFLFAADPKNSFLWAVGRKLDPFSPTTVLAPYIFQ